MALLDVGVKMLANRMPKVLSPKTHAIIDYATAGAFFVMAPILWKRNRRAAIASLACGAAATTAAVLADHPGGAAKVVNFPTHGKMEAGFSGVVASLPSLLGFSGEWPAIFFRSQGLAIAAINGLTDFKTDLEEEEPRFRRRGRFAA